MLLHKWIKLDKKESIRILHAIGDKCDHDFFSDDMTDVYFKTLPFYSQYRLYKISNYATMPIFSVRFLSDGKDFIRLSGLSTPIYEVNHKDPIHLTSKTLIQYLKFFFRYVQGSEGEVFVISAPKEIPYFNELNEYKQQEIIKKFNPITTSSHSDEEGLFYTAHAQILYGDAIIDSDINMRENGTIFFSNQKIIVDRVHLPKNIYKNYDTA